MTNTTDALARTWNNPDAARVWLKRNPQDGLEVKFVAGEYRLVPIVNEADQSVPEFAKEPVMAKPAKKTAAPKAAKDKRTPIEKDLVAKAIAKNIAQAQAEPVAVTDAQFQAAADETLQGASITEADLPAAIEAPAEETPVSDAPAAVPANGLINARARLVIGGLPGQSEAILWARDFAKKTGKPIHIYDAASDELVFTVDAAYLASLKVAKKATAGTKKATGPRAEKTAPTGKRLEVVQLAMRPQGASTKELVALTTWKGCPWSWTFSNPKGTGLADRYGYGFRKDTVDGEVRYYLSAK